MGDTVTDVPTLSGNEITDAVRRNNTQGDGLLPEQGSTGIWEATTNLSADGSAFNAFGNVNAPSLQADAYIGDSNANVDLDYYWFAAGSGTLTDANAKTIAGFNNDPKMADFPGTPTWFWDSGPDTTQVPLVVGQLGLGRV